MKVCDRKSPVLLTMESFTWYVINYAFQQKLIGIVGIVWIILMTAKTTWTDFCKTIGRIRRNFLLHFHSVKQGSA